MERLESKIMLNKPVYLVGFMGSGKSSVGKMLARKKGFTVVDADKYLEDREGRTISQIFAEQGEDRFRDLETKYLHELSGDPQIICTGGGVVKSETNRKIMKENGFVIYLKVTADAAASRIKDKSSRPLFKDLESARKIITERAPLYEEAADAQIDTVGLDVWQISSKVFQTLKENDLVVHI